jgi:uracil-DNA glycosylase family 4
MTAPPPETRDALLALLDWYVESGVDLALDDAPHDRYAESARAPEPAPTPDAPRERIAPTPPAARRPAPIIAAPDAAAQAAEAAAAAAQSLDDLAAALADFPHAPFRDMAQHFLFAAGTPGASLMVLDAAPGVSEETTGEPFSGEQARLLDNMLAAIGRSRETAYLTYVSPWRPPGVMSMTPPQMAILAPFARRHVELARPKVLLLLGEPPARVALSSTETVASLRGKAFEARFGDHAATAFVFNSLDSLIKSPAALKPAAWRDLRAAAALL